MGAILNVCCIYFDKESYNCKFMPKIWGIWSRKCVQVDNPFEPCHLQKEYPNPITKEILQANGVIH